MSTALNYWHYIFLGIVFFIFVGGIVTAFKQKKKKLVFPMIISTVLVSLLLAFFSIVVVDKYTKKLSLYKVKNRRLLSTEQIIYTGFVKNVGNHTVGKVIFEVKLVNKGHATGNLKGANFYKASGFLDFFSGGQDVLFKPQTITKKFVVARNLKAGKAKSFRVYFKYPPYFKSPAQFTKVYGH